jgi:hypothetical protein|tara:strand:- start:1802 stop:1981 length:180 start_codon:yes stop_codon:yes gene_type:complete
MKRLQTELVVIKEDTGKIHDDQSGYSPDTQWLGLNEFIRFIRTKGFEVYLPECDCQKEK